MDLTGYAVIVNMPGYMPDNPPAIFRRLQDARTYAANEAKGFRNEGWKVTGNMRDGYDCEDRESSATYVIRIDGPYLYPEEAFDD